MTRQPWAKTVLIPRWLGRYFFMLGFLFVLAFPVAIVAGSPWYVYATSLAVAALYARLSRTRMTVLERSEEVLIVRFERIRKPRRPAQRALADRRAMQDNRRIVKRGGNVSKSQDPASNTTTSEGQIATGDVGRIIKTPDERKAILDRTLQLWGAKGWRIENRSDFQATVAKGKEVSHVLHFFLTLFTVGIWLIFWLVLGVAGGVKRRMITVDEYGNVVEQKL